MNSSTTSASQPTSRRLGRSAAAIFLGFLTVVVLSLGTDQALHMINVYPPWGQPMHEPGLNALALAYRCVYTVIGGYLAPYAAMRHVLILAIIGLAMGTLGVIGTWNMNLGPRWYPIALAVTGAPLTWLGGVLRRPKRSTR